MIRLPNMGEADLGKKDDEPPLPASLGGGQLGASSSSSQPGFATHTALANQLGTLCVHSLLCEITLTHLRPGQTNLRLPLPVQPRKHLPAHRGGYGSMGLVPWSLQRW